MTFPHCIEWLVIAVWEQELDPHEEVGIMGNTVRYFPIREQNNFAPRLENIIMKIVIYRNRGAVVSNPKLFIAKFKEAFIWELEESVDLEVLDCQNTVQGLSGEKWAYMWLFQPRRRPQKVLTSIPCKQSTKESQFTSKDCRKSFLSTQSRKLHYKHQKQLTGLL